MQYQLEIDKEAERKFAKQFAEAVARLDGEDAQRLPRARRLAREMQMIDSAIIIEYSKVSDKQLQGVLPLHYERSMRLAYEIKDYFVSKVEGGSE